MSDAPFTSNQWVSVEDALPERQLRVLLAFKGMDWISIGGLQAQGFFCDECDGLVRDPYEVVAWRPLPPPFGSPVETKAELPVAWLVESGDYCEIFRYVETAIGTAGRLTNPPGVVTALYRGAVKTGAKP